MTAVRIDDGGAARLSAALPDSQATRGVGGRSGGAACSCQSRLGVRGRARALWHHHHGGETQAAPAPGAGGVLISRSWRFELVSPTELPRRAPARPGCTPARRRAMVRRAFILRPTTPRAKPPWSARARRRGAPESHTTDACRAFFCFIPRGGVEWKVSIFLT